MWYIYGGKKAQYAIKRNIALRLYINQKSFKLDKYHHNFRYTHPTTVSLSEY